MSEPPPFLARVLERAPRAGAGVVDYVFKHWSVPGKATDEALGLLPVPGVDAKRFLAKVMDLDRYKGPIPHVVDSRVIPDPRFPPPAKARFYQRIKIPLLGDVHQEIAIELVGEHAGYEVAAWHMLDAETAALSSKDGIRGQYNDGAWLVASGVVGYALSSAPRRDDVGFLKWKALTSGADVAASKVIRDNIAAMARWAQVGSIRTTTASILCALWAVGCEGEVAIHPSADAPKGFADAPKGSADAPKGSADAPKGSADAPVGPSADAGPAPTGDPATGPGGGQNLTCGGASFPPDATFYQDISAATLDSESKTIIAALDASNWADSGSRQSLGIDFSFEVNCAAASVARRAYVQNGDNQPDCDLAPVPLPAGGKVEGVSDYDCSDGDCHLLVYQGSRLYELYQAQVSGGTATGGDFTGTCLAIWDLGRDYWDPANRSPSYSRGDACDGGNAADLPIAPMLLTKQELAAAMAGDGIIHHALRFTMVNNRIRSTAYVHPATHYGFGGTTGGATTLPTGARLRLRADYPLASLPNDAARVVARTLQHYGMYLADGGNIFISATTDASDLLNNSAVGALRPKDFEMVGGGLRIARHDYSCAHVPITN